MTRERTLNVDTFAARGEITVALPEADLWSSVRRIELTLTPPDSPAYEFSWEVPDDAR